MRSFSAIRCVVPAGLGMASGAMSYVVFKELVPEACELAAPKRAVPIVVTASMFVVALDAYSHFAGFGEIPAAGPELGASAIGLEL
mmetsp:Transcript_34783/g.95935  ORF Transcript_34783/g.95935 Transcript_34783/m.95935 type:complete len:86 (+) Transcript_34783:683-940(+)